MLTRPCCLTQNQVISLWSETLRIWFRPAGQIQTITASAQPLEFAVKDLKVEHIVVMGHAMCGGMKALCSYCQQTDEDQAAETEESRRRFIRGWVDVARPAIEQVDMSQPEPDRLRDAEQASVVNSLQNLRSFSFIKDKKDQPVVCPCMAGGLT